MKKWRANIRYGLRLLPTLLVVVPGVLFAGSASLTLDYTCVFPLLGEQPLEVDVLADMPESVPEGTPTGEFEIDATATVGEETWNGLYFVGGRTIGGETRADAHVSGPGLELPLAVPMSIPEQPIPDERDAFEVNAHGSTPSLVFNEPGEVEISVGDLVMALAPVDANGALTGLGPFEAECVVNPGQDQVLHCLAVGDADGCAVDGEPDGGDHDGLLRIGSRIIAWLKALLGLG